MSVRTGAAFSTVPLLTLGSELTGVHSYAMTCPGESLRTSEPLGVFHVYHVLGVGPYLLIRLLCHCTEQSAAKEWLCVGTLSMVAPSALELSNTVIPMT